MPTPATFYYNSTVFCDATDIWTDNDLTTPAPDGWYQVGEVYRQKIGGVLGPCNACPSCGTGIAACNIPIYATGGQGVYRITFDAGPDVGAVVIKFNPKVIPDMLTVTYDGVSSSEYSSYVHGYKEGYIGKDVVAENVPAYPGGPTGPGLGIQTGSPVGPYPNVTSYVFNPATLTFLPAGTEDIPLVPGTEVNMTTTGYNISPAFTVVPKTDPTVNLVECVVYGPDTATEWNVIAYCPKSLNPFPYNPVSGGVCAPLSKTMYTCSVVPVPGTGTHTLLNVNDWAFKDYAGVDKVTAGIYPVEDGDGVTKCVTVDANGIITNISAACAGSC